MLLRKLKFQILVALQPLQSQIFFQFGSTQCPDNPTQITQDCGDSVNFYFTQNNGGRD